MAGGKRLVLDLSEVHFIDSTALGVLVGTLQQTQSTDGEFRLVVDDPFLLKIFHITGFDGIFSIFPQVADAVSEATDPATPRRPRPWACYRSPLKRPRPQRGVCLLRLIITEKNDAAKKIAGILAKGGVKEESYLRIPYYLFTDAEGQATASVGLKGHVVQVDFPPEFSEWRKVEPKTLIDAPLVKTETAKSVVRTVKKLGRGCFDAHHRDRLRPRG